MVGGRRGVVYLFLLLAPLGLVYFYGTSYHPQLWISASDTDIIGTKFSHSLSNSTDLENLINTIILSNNENVREADFHSAHLTDSDKLDEKYERDIIHPATLSTNNTAQPEYRQFASLDGMRRLVIYSAHYDINDKTVKLAGFGPREQEVYTLLKDYECSLVNENGNITRVPLDIYDRVGRKPGRPDITYDTVIYSCGVQAESPHSVIIRSRTDAKLKFHFPVEGASKVLSLPVRPHTFGVCVKPMYNYTNIDMLRNFITVNTALGAEHFYFYIFNASLEVISLLQKLQERVTLYRWPLDYLVGKVHAYGQKTHNIHCLYSHKAVSRYLLFADIDELLVPTGSKTWSQMMSAVNEAHPSAGNNNILYWSNGTYRYMDIAIMHDMM